MKINKALLVLLCVTLFSACAPKVPEETMTQDAVPAIANAQMETAQSSEPPVLEQPTQEQIAPTVSTNLLNFSMRIPKTFNPLENEDVTVDKVLSLVFEPLISISESQKAVNNLAKSITFSEDGLKATIVLRDDVMWGDGVYLSAADVVYSLKTIEGASELSIYKSAVANVANYTAVDKNTVVVDYKSHYAGEIYNLRFPIIPKHYYEILTKDDNPTNTLPLGNGAYRFDNYKPSKSALLASNPNFFKEKAKIENINVVIINDRSAELYAFHENIIDVVDTKISEWGKYRGTKESEVYEYVSDNYEFIGFNFNKQYLNDKRLRAAVAQAIDIKEIIDNIYLKQAVRAYTPISPVNWAFEVNAEVYDIDLAAAQKLFEEVGFKQTQPLMILVNEENNERVKIAHILSENLKKIHVIAVVNERPFEEYQTMLLSGEFDMFVGGLKMGVVPDLTFAFNSTMVPTNLADRGQNLFNYKNPIMDTMLANVNASKDEAAYKVNLKSIQSFFADELPCVSLVFHKSVILSGSKVKGVVSPVNGEIYKDVNKWYVE